MLFIDQYPELHVLPKLYLEIKYATLTQFDFKRVRVFSLRPQKKKKKSDIHEFRDDDKNVRLNLGSFHFQTN